MKVLGFKFFFTGWQRQGWCNRLTLSESISLCFGCILLETLDTAWRSRLSLYVTLLQSEKMENANSKKEITTDIHINYYNFAT